jgi:undecaprenyl-diphosphatase
MPFRFRFLFVFFLFFFFEVKKIQGQSWEYKTLEKIHLQRNKNLDLAFFRAGQVSDVLAFSYPAFWAGKAALSGDSIHKTRFLESFLGIGLGVSLSYGLKWAIKRPRPFEQFPEIRPPYPKSKSWSFPSGTTTRIFETATMASLHFPKWYVIFPSFTFAGIVACSRIHLGEHYAGDVLAGAALGVASAWLSQKGLKWVNKRKKKMQRPFSNPLLLPSK